jgi:hypothetical protein
MHRFPASFVTASSPGFNEEAKLPTIGSGKTDFTDYFHQSRLRPTSELPTIHPRRALWHFNGLGVIRSYERAATAT